VRYRINEQMALTCMPKGGPQDPLVPYLQSFVHVLSELGYTRRYSPLATPKCLTSGRVKIPHLAVAGRGMITQFDGTWQDAQRIL
jgi:hypothetical protein